VAGVNVREHGQVTDHYTMAIEQLGSDQLDVRIGGIYALERVCRESAANHPAVMSVLAAFIRERPRERWSLPGPGDGVAERASAPDVQAAATVIGHRDRIQDREPIRLARANLIRADLTGADLGAADLTRADLAGANLCAADLIRADLTGANLSGADLTRADLTGAQLIGASLSGSLGPAKLQAARLAAADLTRAQLTGADLSGADLVGADLTSAYLVDVNFIRADLTRTRLIRARLEGADLQGADLTGANLSAAGLTGADLTGARWPEGVRVPEGWMVDSESGRLKPAAQLSEVMAHYLQ
jgi:uncharacterized protein YjbI with pentapeptide repeats